MTIHEALETTLPVIGALDSLGVHYFIGGSLASSLHGLARSTQGTDIVADIKLAHTEPFLSALNDRYYADPDSIRQAIRRQSHFNLLHLDTMFKVDVFVAGTRPYDRVQLERRELQDLTPQEGRQAYVATAADTILAKLSWFRDGGEVSERQWTDVLGMIRVQGERLDLAYLERWAGVLAVDRLLTRALVEADSP